MTSADGLRCKGANPLSEASPQAERLASLVTLSHEPMFIWRIGGPIEFWNTGAERLYGFPRDEAVARESHSLLQTTFPLGFDDFISRLRNEQTWAGELKHICKNGREVIVDSRIQVLNDGTVLEVNRDVTAFKEQEAILRDSQQQAWRLASIVESSNDAIVSKNLYGVITSWNGAAERIFGFTADEAIGQPITIVIPEDRQNEERDILTRIRRGERVDHFETVRRHKRGSLISVSLTISPVRDSEGRVIGASKIARDITEQKRTREQIAILAREAEHRSKNLLSKVMATVNLSQASTPKALKQAIEGRIRALANVHSLFVETRWLGAEMSAIVNNELAPYSESNQTRARVEGPPIFLEPDIAQTIAVTLHELATNAAKYGAWSVPEGHIRLNWSHEVDGVLRMVWIESGGPLVNEPQRKGFGSRVISQFARQFGGEAQFEWRPEGVFCSVVLKL